MILNYTHSNIKFEKNTVIIAGAGPGSKKLVTLKLKFILKLADVIIYDALVNKNILKDCKENALLIYAGKTKKNSCTQSEINHLMVKYANLGKRVLRLKGGDVSFFSRASQEVQFLKENKIKFKVFTAITSSQASVSETDRLFFNKERTCNFFTGHKKINSSSKEVDYSNISKNKGKIFIYMGISQIEEVSRNLQKNHISPDEKVSIIKNASLKNQKIYTTNLKDCTSFIKKNKITSPAILIIR